MRRWRCGWVGVTLAVAVGMVWPQAVMGACGSWQKVSGASGVRGTLVDLSASSPGDVWAVGSASHRTLAEHWDGLAWRRVATPSPGRRSAFLQAVVAIDPGDAWAVGLFGGASSPPLLLHWTGTAWHRVVVPFNARHAEFSALAAVSPNDVWAVGLSKRLLARTMYYNGSRWAVVPAVSSRRENDLAAAVAISANDVWAAGTTLVEHWNGRAWHRLPGPSTSPRILGLAASSSSDIWAVGLPGPRSTISHWDGSSWTTVSRTAGSDALESVATSGSNDAWAVGSNASVQYPLVDHWDGTTWTEALIATRDHGAQLHSVAVVPGTTTYWAVGQTRHFAFPGSYNTPRIEAHC